MLCIMLHHTILYYTMPYYTIVYNIVTNFLEPTSNGSLPRLPGSPKEEKGPQTPKRAPPKAQKQSQRPKKRPPKKAPKGPKRPLKKHLKTQEGRPQALGLGLQVIQAPLHLADLCRGSRGLLSQGSVGLTVEILHGHKRERERDRDTYIYIYMHVYTCMYIFHRCQHI